MLFYDWLRSAPVVKHGSKLKINAKNYGAEDYFKFLGDWGEILRPTIEDLFSENANQVFKEFAREVITGQDNTENTLRKVPHKVARKFKDILDYIANETIPVNLLNGPPPYYNDIFFIDKSTGEIVPNITEDYLRKGWTPKEVSKFMVENSAQLNWTYEKFQGQPPELFKTPEAPFNVYQLPAWRKPGVEPVTDLSEYFWLLDHLFKDQESRTMVEKWVYNSLTHRNQEFLVLMGGEGSGKSTFAERLLFQFHGVQNSYKAPPTFAEDTHFNGFLENITYLTVDELTYRTTKGLEFLKSLSENYLAIERKGIDAKMREIHFSLCITSNYTHSWFMHPETSRKFTYAEMNATKLLSVKTKGEADKLVRTITAPGYLLGIFNHYQRTYGAEATPEVLHGKAYEQHCLDSATAPYRCVLDEIFNTKETEITYGALKRKFMAQSGESRFSPYAFPNPDKLKSYIDAFTWDGKPIAKFDLVSNKVEILLSKKSEVVNESERLI